MGLQHNNNPGEANRPAPIGEGETPDIRRFDRSAEGRELDAPLTRAEIEAAFADEPADSDRAAMVRAAMVRAAADGEITADDLNSAEQASVAFERHLRDGVGRAMAGTAAGAMGGANDSLKAPASLRAKILADSAQNNQSDDEALADGLAARAAETRTPGFWQRSGARIVGGLAAAMLLAVVGVFAWSLGAASNAGAGGNQAFRTDLAQFVAGEHTRTLDDEYAQRKVVYTETGDAASAIRSELHHDPVIPPCGGATKFAGASPCGVPGKGPSAHMQFVLPVHDDNGQIVDGAQGRKVSVFVKQDQGELDIQEGTTYLVDTNACQVNNAYICVWRRDGLLYTLVSEDRNAPMCTTFLAQFGVNPPDPANSL